MVNNSSNINKLNYLSTQIIEHKKTKAYSDEDPGPVLGQTQKCGGIKSNLIMIERHLFDLSAFTTCFIVLF